MQLGHLGGLIAAAERLGRARLGVPHWIAEFLLTKDEGGLLACIGEVLGAKKDFGRSSLPRFVIGSTQPAPSATATL
jgi:hypothetical protein